MCSASLWVSFVSRLKSEGWKEVALGNSAERPGSWVKRSLGGSGFGLSGWGRPASSEKLNFFGGEASRFCAACSAVLVPLLSLMVRGVCRFFWKSFAGVTLRVSKSLSFGESGLLGFGSSACSSALFSARFRFRARPLLPASETMSMSCSSLLLSTTGFRSLTPCLVCRMLCRLRSKSRFSLSLGRTSGSAASLKETKSKPSGSPGGFWKLPPKIWSPMKRPLRIILFCVRVPVLSVRMYSISPSSSLTVLVFTLQGMSRSLL